MRTAAVFAAVAAVVLVGCAPGDTEPRAATPVAPAPAADLDPADPGDLSPLGNVRKDFGEPSGLGNPDNPLLTFTLGAPTDAVCDTSFGDEPENGRWVEFPLAVETFDDPDEMLLLAAPGPHSFEFVDPDGRSTPEVATVSAAMACGFDAPMEIRPNRSYDYPIVLDLPDGPGTLVLDVGSAGGGWEWEIA